MHKPRYRIVLALLISLFLSSCLPSTPLAVTEPLASVPSAQSSPTEWALKNYTNADFGFSLSYPAGFEVQSSAPPTVVFLAPQGAQGHRERAFLNVELTFDSNAEWYASQVQAANAGLGTEITSAVEVLDGQRALILGRLPGQDLNRQVFIVLNGMLYHFTFMPDDPAAGEPYEQMQALYAAITASLRFMPDRSALPPVTDVSNMAHQLELALNARSAGNIGLLLGDQFALGQLSKAGAEPLTFSPLAAADVAQLVVTDDLSQTPALTVQYQVDWASVPGSLDRYDGYFPGEVLTPLLAKGWGPNGADQAVLLIARSPDGTLFWRGAFVLD